MATELSYRRLKIVGALLILLGLALVIGGVMLVVAGGSVAYLLAGLGFGASGALLWRRSASAPALGLSSSLSRACDTARQPAPSGCCSNRENSL